MYKKIDGANYKKIFVVGDLHGCFNRLMSHLDDLEFDRDSDLLVSVGDLIDRGPQSIECLDLINEPWFESVRGNHEEMAIEAVSGSSDGRLWFHNGGDWFLQLDPDQAILARSLIAKAASLPYVIELNTSQKRIVIAHADYPSNEYQFGKDIDQHMTVWSRERFSAISDGIDLSIAGADAFIFGHTPIRHAFSPYNLHYIDTGAVFGNLLTLVQVQ